MLPSPGPPNCAMLAFMGGLSEARLCSMVKNHKKMKPRMREQVRLRVHHEETLQKEKRQQGQDNMDVDDSSSSSSSTDMDVDE